MSDKLKNTKREAAYNSYIQYLNMYKPNEEYCYQFLVDLGKWIFNIGSLCDKVSNLKPLELVPSDSDLEKKIMKIKQFSETYEICSESCIANLLSKDITLKMQCGKRIGNKWYVYPDIFISYLSKCKEYPVLKNRCVKYLNKKERECQK